MLAYQHERYVRQALDALVAQSCQSFKLVAIDDGSTDATYSILQEYESGLLRGKMTLLTHPGHKNCGIYASYRRCLENLETEFFMGHASDDFLEQEAIEYLLHVMDTNLDADFIYGPCKVIDETGCIQHYMDGTQEIGDGLKAFLGLLRSNHVREPTMLYRSNCASVIMDDHSDVVYGDWLHNLTFFSMLKPHRYSQPILSYRIHASNVANGIDQKSLKHLQRSKEFIAAALSNKCLMMDHKRKALLLIAGLEICPKPNPWPSLFEIFRYTCSLSREDASAVASELAATHLPQSIHPSLAVILICRAAAADRMYLLKSYLSNCLRTYKSLLKYVWIRKRIIINPLNLAKNLQHR